MLAPGLVRDAPARRVELTPAVASLRLRLTLPSNAGHSTFRAVLRTAEGREAWIQGGLRPSPADRRELVVTVPASVLIPADYELALQGVTGSGPEDVAEYHFMLVRRR